MTNDEAEKLAREIAALRNNLEEQDRAAEAKLVERKAELERADNLILWINKWVGGLHAHGNMAEEIVVKISEYFAARQQQRASAER